MKNVLYSDNSLALKNCNNDVVLSSDDEGKNVQDKKSMKKNNVLCVNDILKNVQKTFLDNIRPAVKFYTPTICKMLILQSKPF